MQLPLCNPPRLLYSGTPRPELQDEMIRQEAVKGSLPKFRAYFAAGNQKLSAQEQKAVIQDLVAVLNSANLDGYHLAALLDHSYHWGADSELVELCEDLVFELYRVHTQAVEAWVLAINAQPKLGIGDKVRIKRFSDTEYHHGEITSINYVRGEYTVYVPTFGHCLQGAGCHGTIRNWEDLEKDQPHEK